MCSCSLRAFQRTDIEFAVAQTRREGWDATTDVFELCLAHDPHGCFVAEVDGQRQGMVTSTRYTRTGWIGNLIVVPQYRRRGIGETLMRHAMSHLSEQGVHTIRLEADPPGVKLYRRLGLVDEFESPRFHGVGHASPRPPHVEPIEAADLDDIATFDAERFGDHREQVLALLFAQARATYQIRKKGQVRGYALVVPIQIGARIGPMVAADEADADALLGAILAGCADTPLNLVVPGVNDAALALYASRGFERMPPCRRMVYGPAVAAGLPEQVYAIANGALG